MSATALKIPSRKDAEQAQAAVRALSGLLRRKSPRTIRVQPEGAKEQITVTVPTEAFELFLDILANRKQVWLMIALAAGLSYLARRRRDVPEGDPAEEPELALPHDRGGYRVVEIARRLAGIRFVCVAGE